MLRYIWELPQNLLGLLVILFSHAAYDHNYESSKVYHTSKMFGVSLGKYIIVYALVDEETIRHEYGHSIQSLYLGPLYLIIIGIPSFTMNLLTRMGVLSNERYYKRWPENWADQLEGVKRVNTLMS